MLEGVCAYCGKPFRRNRGPARDAAKYCSRECNFAAQSERKAERDRRKREERQKELECVCARCGRTFTAKRVKIKYCSKECCYEANKEKARERMRVSRPLIFTPKKVKCRWCGKEFETQYKKSKVFCSDACKKAKQKEDDRKISRLRGCRARKRLVGKIVDKDITMAKLLKRDKGRCKLCGGLVDVNDYEIVNNHVKCGSRYPTIDHIIPLSQGGLHSWANVQLAHFLCNSYKGDSFLVPENICAL